MEGLGHQDAVIVEPEAFQLIVVNLIDGHWRATRIQTHEIAVNNRCHDILQIELLSRLQCGGEELNLRCLPDGTRFTVWCNTTSSCLNRRNKGGLPGFEPGF